MARPKKNKTQNKEIEENSSIKSEKASKKKTKSRGKSEAESKSKNMKKYKKLIKTTYFNLLGESKEDLEGRLVEKMNIDNIIRPILIELAIKLREFDFHNRKQWQILKKFNLQEKIYREESQILINSEKLKTRDFFREAIYKLEAAQISGFEDKEVLKTKIFNKIKQKYQIDEEMLNELRSIFNEIDIIEEEDTLLDKRTENFIDALKSIVSKNSFLSTSNDYDIRNAIHISKQELKRYEKELEAKSGQYISASINNNQSEDFTMKNSLNFHNNNFADILTNSNQKPKIQKADIKYDNNVKRLFTNEYKIESNDDPSQDYIIEDNPYLKQIDNFPLINKEPTVNHMEHNSILKLSDKYNISAELADMHKNAIFENLSEMAKTHETMINETRKRTSNIYKSKVLNDLYMKLTLFNKLSEFEIQILIYLTQIVVKDIVDAKISEKNYEGDLHPEDLLDLLKRFKNEIQSSSN